LIGYVFTFITMFQFLFMFLTFCSIAIYSEEPTVLENLDYRNPVLKELRQEVFHNLKVSKSHILSSQNKLIPLRFFTYTVKPKETFFFIMARTGTDLETLASTNILSSPQDIRVGMVLWIPNMRGSFRGEELGNTKENQKALAEKYKLSLDHIVYDKKQKRWTIAGQTLDIKEHQTILAEKYKLPLEYIVYDKKQKKWFIVGKPLTKVEKSYFYGFAFKHPLLKGRSSSDYGYRKDPFSKRKTFHGGIDIAAPKGTSVLAAAEGKVIFAGRKKGYGKIVVLQHKLGYETRYGHLNSIEVKIKDTVKQGDMIGEVGSTGRATGPHLHFEVRRFSKKQKPVFDKHL
jgi:murein DD-endopeptidase MepM/ murein hydrolase activator NlpD